MNTGNQRPNSGCPTNFSSRHPGRTSRNTSARYQQRHVFAFTAYRDWMQDNLCPTRADSPTSLIPDPGGASEPVHATAPAARVQVITAGGMPGWQITLIAVAAALVAATAAVFLDRCRKHIGSAAGGASPPCMAEKPWTEPAKVDSQLALHNIAVQSW